MKSSTNPERVVQEIHHGSTANRTDGARTVAVAERRVSVVRRRRWRQSGGPRTSTSRSPRGRPLTPSSSSVVTDRVADGRQLRPQQTIGRRRRLANERQSRHLPYGCEKNEEIFELKKR